MQIALLQLMFVSLNLKISNFHLFYFLVNKTLALSTFNAFFQHLLDPVWNLLLLLRRSFSKANSYQ